MNNIFHKRVPIFFQIEAAECGAASLCMILGYYGKYIELSKMRRDCKVSRDGSKLSYIMATARKYGFSANAYRKSAELIDVELPAIIFWRYNHFVVLERITDKWIYISDPSVGHRRITPEEFNENYSGIICEIKPTEQFEKSGKPFRNRDYIGRMLAKQQKPLLVLALLYILVNLIGMGIQGMSRLFTDYYMPSISAINVSSFFMVYVVLLILQFLIVSTRIRIVNRFYRIESAQISGSIIKKLLSLPTSYFQTRSHAKIISKLDSIESLSDFVSAKIVPMMMGIVFSVMYVGLLHYYNPIICLVTVAIIAVVLLIMQVLLRTMKNVNMSMMNEQMNFFAGVMQTFRLFSTIKSTAGENDNLRKNIRAYNAYESSTQHAKAYAAVMSAIPVVVPFIIQIEVICIGAAQVIEGKATVGIVLACQGIATLIFSPLAEFISNFSLIQAQDVNVRGIKDIEEEAPDNLLIREGGIIKDKLEGRIEMKNVSFGYNTALPNIIEDISVLVEPGKSIAFVGESGAGKTTILRLLEGLYEPLSGDVLFDGLPICQISRETMSGSVAVVSQKSSLFWGTVRDNISLFDNSVPMKQIEEAAENACIYNEIEAHEGGFNAVLNEQGYGYSGGQIQRMMIARALVRKPSILILDEATSALDPLIEEKIMDNIKKLGITLVIVAHRLSTIKDCDRIVVLDHGKIVESGSHSELLSDSYSYYKQLVKSLQEGE